MPVIDADAHVIETERTWDWLDPDDRQYRPTLVMGGESQREHWVIDGKVGGFRFPTLSEQELARRSERSGRDIVTPREAREMDDVELRLAHMDRLGIDIQVLHNTLFISPITDRPEVEVALCHAYNSWLADIWKQGRGRLRWSLVPPTLSMPDALAEIRAGKENGAVAVLMRPVEGERLLADPYFYPIYQEAEHLDLAIAVHIANGNPVLSRIYGMGNRGSNGFSQFRAPTVMACQQLIMSEVPELFPTLRWGFIEASAQWVPWVVADVVERFTVAGKPIPDNVLEANRIYVTCQNNDDLPWVLKYAGERSIVIGTDYGHTDPSSELDAIAVLKERDDIAETSIRNILEQNPAALYGVQPALSLGLGDRAG